MSHAAWDLPCAASLTALLICACPVQAVATGVPAGFADQQVAAGLLSPTAITALPDGRLLVVQQDGVIRMIKEDGLLATPFYSVADVDIFSERGCLGIVADPAFALNHHVYVYCTIKHDPLAPSNGQGRSSNRLLRLTEAADAAAPDSLHTVLQLPDVPTGVQWHMGGALRFGIDGKLYIAVGGHEDLRVTPATASFSQTLATPFGKILRINSDGSFPSDNPFVTTPGAWQGIFALGLRNPFSFDIQPGTGLMLINDVGGGSVEEINQGLAGANYGWPVSEGRSNDSGYTNALYEYRHTGGLCAITGAAFYNPDTQQFPASYAGKFLYADFCAGSIFVLDPGNPAQPAVFASAIGSPVSLAVAPDGSLYYLARNQDTGKPVLAAGTVGKITYSGSPATSLTVPAQTPIKPTIGHLPLAIITSPAPGSEFAPGELLSFSGVASDAEDGLLSEAGFTWQIDFRHDTHAHPAMAATSGVAQGNYLLPAIETELANTWFRISLTVRDALQQETTEVRDIFPGRQLSAMQPVGSALNGRGEIGKDRRADAAQTPISLDGITYAKGLAMHAPADVRYQLGAACSGHLIADLGIDDAAGEQGSVIFQVYLDAIKVFDSGLQRGSGARIPVLIPVAGKNELRLVVNDAGDGNALDLANWGGARVSGCSADAGR